MIIKNISNASCVIEGFTGSRLLTDPWFNDGVMEGSWCNLPPIITKTSDYHDVDLIYLSHLHPDHYDERFFDFPKKIPIVILDHGNNYLQKILIKNGYKNLILIKNGESLVFKEFIITLYSPFVKNAYEHSEVMHMNSLVGNLIDSAMVVESNNFNILNFNDNKPNIKACKMLKEKFHNIDLALLNYNAANCYPSCFNNLSDNEKFKEKNRIIKRNYDHMINLINTLEPKTVFPFAGTYILGGKESIKNKYLATGSVASCKEYISDKVNSQIINLSENNRYDLSKQKCLDELIHFTKEDIEKLVDTKIKDITYPFEKDDFPNIDILIDDVKKAALLMKKRMKNLGFKCKSNVFINIDNKYIKIHSSNSNKIRLECSLDLRLLRRMLNRKANWNNAEIGAHINFIRNPNIHEPDIHTALQFLHL